MFAAQVDKVCAHHITVFNWVTGKQCDSVVCTTEFCTRVRLQLFNYSHNRPDIVSFPIVCSFSVLFNLQQMFYCF